MQVAAGRNGTRLLVCWALLITCLSRQRVCLGLLVWTIDLSDLTYLWALAGLRLRLSRLTSRPTAGSFSCTLAAEFVTTCGFVVGLVCGYGV